HPVPRPRPRPQCPRDLPRGRHDGGTSPNCPTSVPDCHTGRTRCPASTDGSTAANRHACVNGAATTSRPWRGPLRPDRRHCRAGAIPNPSRTRCPAPATFLRGFRSPARTLCSLHPPLALVLEGEIGRAHV